MGVHSISSRLPSGSAIKLGLFRTWQLIFNAAKRLGEHRGTQLAAAMGYYGLLSVFPLLIVAVGITGILLNSSTQAEIVNFLLRELPLESERSRDKIDSLVEGVVANAGTVGLVGAAGLIFTSSALMGSARNALSIAFEEPFRRGVLRSKLVDVLVVFGLGAVFVASFAATLIGQLDIVFGGGFGDAIDSTYSAGGFLLAPLLAAFVFIVLFRFLPVTRPPLADVWPGVLFAALGYEALKRAFSVYLDQFANYNAIYGSLGAVIAFLVFIYLASLVFLMGAEIAALWPRARA
ncbi:MAG: YihY/virulence factor BrkB family protein, partial [Solirubrobacterales bacterium]